MAGWESMVWSSVSLDVSSTLEDAERDGAERT